MAIVCVTLIGMLVTFGGSPPSFPTDLSTLCSLSRPLSFGHVAAPRLDITCCDFLFQDFLRLPPSVPPAALLFRWLVGQARVRLRGGWH